MTAYRIYRRQPTGLLDSLIGARYLTVAPDGTVITATETLSGAHRAIRRHQRDQHDAAQLIRCARLVDQVPA